MKIKIYLLACIALIIISSSCTKEKFELPPTNIPEWTIYDSANSELPDNQVQAIAIDRKDVKWFGTTNGLASFNGSAWKVYTTANSGLPSSFITALEADGTGNLWVGTNKGLAKFDGKSWSLFNSGNSALANESVTRLLYDKTKSVLWIGTDVGLVKFDGTTWTRFDENNSGLIEGFIRSLAIDNDGNLWVGTFNTFRFYGHIWKFDGKDWTSTRLDRQGLPSSFPEGMVFDAQNVMWIGLKGTMGGILVKIQDYKWDVYNSSVSPGLHGGINAVTRVGNSILLSGGSGLLSLTEKSWNLINTSNSKLPENALFTTVIDSKGNKWIGTYTKGVAVYRGN